MSFKLAAVGHADSLREIINTVQRNFRDVEVFGIEFGSDDVIESALVNIKKMMGLCHGVLYTRIDPYKLISERLEHEIPVRYVEINSSHLILGLSKMMYHHSGADITNVSIDTLEYHTIAGAYKALGIDEHSLKIIKAGADTNTKNFVLKAEDEHVNNFTNGLCTLCVTGITHVYKRLLDRNIPCVLLMPTTETYVDEIQKLMYSHRINKMNENQIVVMYINISPKDSFYLYSENQFKEILETQKAREQIALFSQKLNGALFAISESRYVIVCGGDDAEMATDNYASIDLLAGIGKESMFNVSIGIGYGESARAARQNAVAGINKALKEQGDKAYVVYGRSSAVGPIESTLADGDADEEYGRDLSEAAARSGLGINTLYKLRCAIERKKTSRFTSAELAEYLGTTVRTANRIIEKLSESGYAAQIGTQPVGLRGRPERIIRILI